MGWGEVGGARPGGVGCCRVGLGRVPLVQL